ncbi:MAG: penicillin-binding protein 2 [Gammaproteobacteria bacterium]|nr:penicillin-binding protein 2 [Gammaproteobacteria bacterium]
MRQTIRDHHSENRVYLRRALVCVVGMLMLVGLLLTNLYRLQITEYDNYQTKSNENRISLQPVAPTRGLIYDRNGILLADNRPVYSIEVVPEQVEDIAALVDALAPLLSLDDKGKQRAIKAVKAARRYDSVVIKNHISELEASRFSVEQYRYPGAYLQARLTRHYPYADALTHVLGYVAKINEADAKRLEAEGLRANYRASVDIGKQGVEKYYERLLHGTVGYEEVEVNNRNRPIRTLKYTPPTAGQDLVLNIDLNLQLLAHQLMAGKRGAVVALEPRTGAVLALVSAPSYDPNLFVEGISGTDYRRLLNDPNRPLVNRTSQGGYPPASTIKPLMVLFGLEQKLVTEHTRIYDPGWYQLPGGGRRFRDWKRTGHGIVDFRRAIEESCDTYFYEMAPRIDIDKLANFMGQFGFGQFSGIDIHEESRGIMPSREWKRARFRDKWYQGDSVSVMIGQGYWTATTLQLAVSTAIIANHGEHPEPRVIKAIQSKTGTLDWPVEHRPKITLGDDRHWTLVEDAMFGVNHRPNGTANKAFKDATYTSAGKTGTAQVFSLRENEEYDAKTLAAHKLDNAMYIVFAPRENPQIVLAVTMENAGGGSANAAPVARRLLDHYLNR